jgi:hypothetical protein
LLSLSEKPFEIGMGKYIKYGNPFYSSEEIEINHALGWGLFNHDEKIFLFYKKNNQILGLLYFVINLKKKQISII